MGIIFATVPMFKFTLDIVPGTRNYIYLIKNCARDLMPLIFTSILITYVLGIIFLLIERHETFKTGFDHWNDFFLVYGIAKHCMIEYISGGL